MTKIDPHLLFTGRHRHVVENDAVLYDTEIIPHNRHDDHRLGLFDKDVTFFQRPLGQYFTWRGKTKTYRQTNMVMSGCLPCPCEMAITGFRMGLDLERPYVDRLRVFSRAVIEIRIGERIPWIGPMSVIPCGRMLETHENEHLDLVFGDPEMPPTTPFIARLAHADAFQVKMYFPDPATLEEGEPGMYIEGDLPVAFYFFGKMRRGL